MAYQPFTQESLNNFGGDIDAYPTTAKKIYKDKKADLIATDNGDLKILTGPELVIHSRLKELLSPVGFLGRYVRDSTGIKYIDFNYGNPSSLVLSEPTNTIPLEAISKACEDIMLLDSRVKSVFVRPNFLLEENILFIQIDYKLSDGSAGTFEMSINPRR